RKSRGASIAPLSCEPAEQSLGWPAVHNPIARDPRQARMRQRGVGVSPLKGCWPGAVGAERAAGGSRISRQCVIEILTSWIAIEFHGHTGPRRSCKDHRPIRYHASARSGNTAARVREDADMRVLHGAEEPIGLIVRAAQLRMRRGQDELEARRFIRAQVE